MSKFAERVLDDKVGFASMAEKRRVTSFLKDHLRHAKEGNDFHTTKEALLKLGVSINEIRDILET